MRVIRDPQDMQAFALQQRAEGRTLGVVPTMGYLHAGHVSLMALLRPRCETLIVTIFVNPAQFNDPKDLELYPRDEAGDLAKCEQAGTDVVFLPEAGAMYPAGFETAVDVPRLGAGLCGAHRPGHFRGVATVVAKLFMLTQPHFAAFGEKDFQQLAVIRRMVRDLAIPVEIVPGPTLREADGLAMSSRNARLSPAARRVAPALRRALLAVKDAAGGGEADAARLIAAGAGVLAQTPEFSLEYLEMRGRDDLAPLSRVDRPAVAIAAAWLDGVRLIDNIEL